MLNAVIRLCSVVFGFLLLFPLPAISQSTYPDKPVRIVVPFPAGGPTDIFARLVAKKLSDAAGQQFFVENLPGAGGNVGTQTVVNTRPDGYSLLFASASLAISPSLYAKLSYDPLRDLAPIALVGIAPMILVTHAGGPANVAQLIDMTKASPDKYSYASAGNGSATHLGGEAFKARAKVSALHVPYRGTAPALIDVIAGRHLFIFDYVGPIKTYAADGRLRILAIASEKRSPLLPNVPTLSESGLAGFTSSTWNMFLAPAQTPKTVLDQLNSALNRVLKDPEVTQRLAELGIEPVSHSTRESAKAFLQDEIKRWAGVVESSGAKLD